MTDWLWVIGEVALTYGFYRYYKSNQTFVANLEVAPDLNIDELKKFSSSNKTIPYAFVHGTVQPTDTKANSVFQSQFISTLKGVVQQTIIHQQNFQKGHERWNKTKTLVNDVVHHLPFRLISLNGNSIHIDKPSQFTLIDDLLVVTHVKFEPSPSSSMGKLIEAFSGNVSTGIETTEKMLLVDTPLTGIGRLEKQSGNWHLIPHEEWGGVLSRLSRTEILSKYRTRAEIGRILSILLGVIACCTVAYIAQKYYINWQRRRIDRLPTPAPPAQNNDNANPNNRLQCIICLQNDIIYMLQPCSHLGLCDSCSQSLQAGNHEQELCPICRTPIQQYQRIYLP